MQNMKKQIIVNPTTLKGYEVNERIKELMGIKPINENTHKSVVELTKLGPDGKVYGIVRENHEYYIKSAENKKNLVAEDFQYIGGLQNKKDEAHPSYAKATKQLNLKFISLNEMFNSSTKINIFENDNLHANQANGFSGAGNLEGNETMWENENQNGQLQAGTLIRKDGIVYSIGDMSDPQHIQLIDKTNPNSQNYSTLNTLNHFLRNNDIQIVNGIQQNVSEDINLTEDEQAIDDMLKEDTIENDDLENTTSNDDAYEKAFSSMNENKNKLSIARALTEMDSIIEGLERKKKSLHTNLKEDVKYKLKLGSEAPAAQPTPEAPVNSAEMGGLGNNQAPVNEPSSNDKPFDDEPFDAGIETDEQSDPKKFIQQLSGKLGQSLRSYTKQQGGPDLELEKFAVNSLLSATHTSEMDQEDQSDIINKVKSAGENQPEEPTNNDMGGEEPTDPTMDAGGEEGNDDDIDFSGGLEESNKGKTPEELYPNVYPEGWKEMDGLFMNPKKNNMFQPNSNDILKNNIKESEKSGIFVKNRIKLKLQESFNQEDMQNTETVEPVVKPQVQPKTQPTTKPTRKNVPFLPEVTPSVQPAPKAKVEAVTENEFEGTNTVSAAPAEKKTDKPKEPQLAVSPEIQKLASELAAYCKNANDMIDKIGTFVKNKNITDSIMVTSVLAKTAEIIKNR